MSSKITHRCLKHNELWDTTPERILKGVGCPVCHKEKIHAKQVKTTNQYKEEVASISPHIKVVGEYIDVNTRIIHRCNKHNIEWETSPASILQGTGCKLCAKEKIRRSNGKTHCKYTNELHEVNPNIAVIGEYQNNSTKIRHKCLIDGYEWDAIPANLLNGSGCPVCSNTKRRSHDEYVDDVAINNPNIDVIGKFSGMRTPVLHRCKKHGIEWEAFPHIILKGSGCKECSKEKIALKNGRTNEQYIIDLQEINKNIVPLEEYVNARLPILHKCLICNHEWMVTPGSLMSGTGCPKCAGVITRTQEEYTSELSYVNNNIVVLGEYINSTTPILHKCLKCDNEWDVSPSSVLNGSGCPKCNESRGERAISVWLDNNNIQYIQQMKFLDCKDSRSLPFDFYLPESNKAIEYDGRQHFMPIDYFGGQDAFEILQRHDQIKTDYCEKNGIDLLRIPYTANIEAELNNFLFI